MGRAVFVIAMLLATALAGCGGPKGDSAAPLQVVAVPWLRVGANATYSMSGEAPTNTFYSMGKERVQAGANVFPVGNATLGVSTYDATIVLPTGDIGPAVAMRYDLATGGEPFWLATQYLDATGGELAFQDHVRRDEAGATTNVVTTRWTTGTPDLLLAALFSGRNITAGFLETSFESAPVLDFHGHDYMAWNVTVADGVATTALRLATSFHPERHQRFEMTWDAVCPFPASITYDGNYGWSALRTQCHGGDGAVVAIGEPSPQNEGPSPHWLRVSADVPGTSGQGPSLRGFALADAWQALTASPAYQDNCSGACPAVHVEWAEVDRVVACGLVPQLGIQTCPEHVLQWNFIVTDAVAVDTFAFTVERTPSATAVFAVEPWLATGLPGPGADAWGLDLGALLPGIEAMFGNDTILHLGWTALAAPAAPAKHNSTMAPVVAWAERGTLDRRAGTSALDGKAATWMAGLAGKLLSAGDVAIEVPS